MELIDIVKKLVGPVSPLGDSSRDNERLENLKALCSITEDLVSIIYATAKYRDSYEHSVKEIGEYAEQSVESINQIIN